MKSPNFLWKSHTDLIGPPYWVLGELSLGPQHPSGLCYPLDKKGSARYLLLLVFSGCGQKFTFKEYLYHGSHQFQWFLKLWFGALHCLQTPVRNSWSAALVWGNMDVVLLRECSAKGKGYQQGEAAKYHWNWKMLWYTVEPVYLLRYEVVLFKLICCT